MPTIWLADAPPASAGADDDEFADASGGVPAGWTEVDHGAQMTVVEDVAGLRLFQATHAGDGVSGVYKPIPAGNFTAWTKVSTSGATVVNSVGAGLGLWQDATDAVGDLVTLTLWMDSTQTAIRVFSWAAYNSFTSAPATSNIAVDVWPTHVYLRVRRTGTTYAFDFSSDGVGWQRVYTTGALGFTPLHYGPVMSNSNSGADAAARFAFFRYVASDVGPYTLMEGDRVTAVVV